MPTKIHPDETPRPYTVRMMGDALRSSFRTSISERRRRMGLEVERVIVEAKDGSPMTAARRKELIEGVAAADPAWVLNGEQTLWKQNNGYPLSIQRELGISIVEFAGAPHTSLEALELELRENLPTITRTARELGLLDLGSGISPYAVPDERQMTPGRRYRAFRPFLGDLIYLHTISAVVHPNIEVSLEEVPRLMEMLKRYIPPISAVFGNSPIYMGRDSGRSSVREGFWDQMTWKYLQLVGIPPKVESMHDVLDMVLDMPAFVTSKGKDYLAYREPTTLRSVIGNGSADAYSVEHHERAVTVIPGREELYTQLGALRHCVRPRIGESDGEVKGRLEVRIADTPRSISGIMSIAAIVRGLVANADAAMERLAMHGDDTIGAARVSAIDSGLKGAYDGEPMLEVARDMVRLALEGLRLAGENERYLAYAQEIVDSGTNMADMQRRNFHEMPRSRYLRSIEAVLRD
ncbi:MAG: hypothetical protein KGH69_02870 [Candidatus Micrarchaeota archaeon]|nr:hypothetical protein [Candidatus Micrarchaeota archaeon]